MLCALGICDFEALSSLFFPLQSLGFMLAGIGLLMLLCRRQGSTTVAAAAPPFFSGTFLFVGLMIAGLTLVNGALVVLSAKMKKPMPIVLFVVLFVFSLGMGYLSSGDFSGALMNWGGRGGQHCRTGNVSGRHGHHAQKQPCGAAFAEGRKSMTDKLLNTIKAKYPLREQDVGDFSDLKASGMKFHIRAYQAEGLGHVSVMTASGFLGLMKMDTLIVVPEAIDLPIYSYNRIYAMGNDTLICELYDTMIEKADAALLDTAKAQYASLPERDPGAHWYDTIKLPQSISKKAKKTQTAEMDKLTAAHFAAYLDTPAAAVRDPAEKRRRSEVYVQGLLDNGGPSTDAFVKALGKTAVTKLFRSCLFGLDEAVPPRPAWEDTVKAMREEQPQYERNRVVKAAVSRDGERRFVLLEREDGNFCYVLERLRALDDKYWADAWKQGKQPAAWFSKGRGSSIFGRESEAWNEFTATATYKQYFADEEQA